MQITEVSVVGVRSSVLVFQRRDTPLRFVLIPTIHFGQQTYYQQITITDRLSRCQLIVAEGEDVQARPAWRTPSHFASVDSGEAAPWFIRTSTTKR